MKSYLIILLFAAVSCTVNTSGRTELGETLIILGFPANEDGTPSKLLKYRLDRALQIYRQEQVSHIIVTGGAVQNDHTEAEVMKTYLMKNGIPEEKIITETRANSTFGNAYYSSRILKKIKAKNPVIITSEEHEERAGKTFSVFISDYRFPDR